jgi:hypothetical protein
MNRFRYLLALFTCLVLVAFALAQDMPAHGTTHVTLATRRLTPRSGFSLTSTLPTGRRST